MDTEGSIAQGFDEHWVGALQDCSYLRDVASPDAGGVALIGPDRPFSKRVIVFASTCPDYPIKEVGIRSPSGTSGNIAGLTPLSIAVHGNSVFSIA